MEPPAPRPILIAALLRRAMEDVRLIWQIRDAKAALTVLLQKGQVGDNLWERFLAAEKELELEIIEVVGEANTFLEGYGAQIFGIASDMVSHEKWKNIYLDIPKARIIAGEFFRFRGCWECIDGFCLAERAAAGPPSSVLAPLSYLTPSSLTLSPSNPVAPPPAIVLGPLRLLEESAPAPIELPAAVDPSPLLALPPPIPAATLPSSPLPSAPESEDEESQPSTTPGSPSGTKSTPSKNKKKKKKAGK